ncbi:MarR family transcriptional regulator, partial [Streptococcus suis]
MEKNDFIPVLPSQFDRRYTPLVVTEKGRSKICHLKSFREEMHHSLFRGLQQEEFDLVRHVADHFTENLQRSPET